MAARQRKTKKQDMLRSGLVEDADQTSIVKTRTGRAVKIYRARGKYNIVDGYSQTMVQPTSADNRPEDLILDPSRRARLLTLTRNLVRNSSLFNTILGQLSTNVVSTCGGKVVLSLPNETANKALRQAFAKWTRNADFYTGDTFNHLLKRILREYVIGGDCVILFDDGLVEDSGKVLLFESNEIVDVPQPEVEKRYGKGAWSRQGKVYSAHGRHIGTVVSKSQRTDTIPYGQTADPDKCYYLKKDPNGSPLENYWFHFSSNWRQGRGVSQAAAAISTIHQLEDLVQSELLASRRNSQIFCWLTQTPEPELATAPLPFDPSTTDLANMTDEEVELMVKEEDKDTKTISFNKAVENSVVYEALPEGFDAKQLQMNHPNSNIQAMVDWLANRCAATMGLSRIFATGNPDSTNWRANQLFTYPTIREFQKEMEQICDFVFAKWVDWALKRGIVTQYVAEDYMEYCDWQWKGLDDLDEVAHQQGIRLALENNTLTYKELLGNDWKSKLEQTSYEHKWMAEHGITHPSEKMISGGETQASKNNANEQTEQTTQE